MKSSRTELDVYLAEMGLEVGGKVLDRILDSTWRLGHNLGYKNPIKPKQKPNWR